MARGQFPCARLPPVCGSFQRGLPCSRHPGIYVGSWPARVGNDHAEPCMIAIRPQRSTGSPVKRPAWQRLRRNPGLWSRQRRRSGLGNTAEHAPHGGNERLTRKSEYSGHRWLRASRAATVKHASADEATRDLNRNCPANPCRPSVRQCLTAGAGRLLLARWPRRQLWSAGPAIWQMRAEGEDAT